MKRRFAPWAAALAALLALPAAAQEPGWNTPRALDLVQRAQTRRTQALADTGMVDYQADARGYVYFYLDRRDIDERTLVKTDQVALQVFWKAPNQTKQVIVGLRDRKSLPTNIHYHLDHLAVVQDNFGDLIRIGDGDEVSDVLHPAAPQGAGFYDYRLADSLTIRVPGAGEPVRVYRLDVRPKDGSRHALVGAIYVDQRQGDIVRMEFTFTRSSYVDRQLDYINISLENGLWKGRFWLPNRQQVEIRRQLPELGFPAGGVIRGTMTVNGYRFNQGLPDWRFQGPRVVAVPMTQARGFAFERGIDAELREQGIGPERELGEVRREAAELIREHALSGLPATRLDVPAASTIARYNRAEGLAVGFGVRSSPREQVVLGAYGGWAFGPMHPLARGDAALTKPGFRLAGSGYLDQPRDIAVGPVISGAMNTLSSALAGRDYSDLFYAAAPGWICRGRCFAGWTGTFAVRGRRTAQRLAADRAERVRRLPPGAADRRRGDAGRGHLPGARVAVGEGGGVERGVGVDGGLLALRRGADRERRRLGARVCPPAGGPGAHAAVAGGGTRLEAGFSAGAAAGTLPAQALYLIGGRGTVPGYAFRAYGGDRFATLRATLSTDVRSPFLRGRLFGAAGWADAGGPGADALARWGAVPMGAPKLGVGAGVGIFYDILRVDLARGLSSGGRWEADDRGKPQLLGLPVAALSTATPSATRTRGRGMMEATLHATLVPWDTFYVITGSVGRGAHGAAVRGHLADERSAAGRRADARHRVGNHRCLRHAHGGALLRGAPDLHRPDRAVAVAPAPARHGVRGRRGGADLRRRHPAARAAADGVPAGAGRLGLPRGAPAARVRGRDGRGGGVRGRPRRRAVRRGRDDPAPGLHRHPQLVGHGGLHHRRAHGTRHARRGSARGTAFPARRSRRRRR